MDKIRLAVAGCGKFGRNHLRVLQNSPRVQLAAVVDSDNDRAAATASEFSCLAFPDVRDLAGKVDAVIVATPTTSHREIGCLLLESGIDVLVEKPIAHDLDSARELVGAASANSRILQVGHLERFNPAVLALEGAVQLPLFFEVHRLSVFTPRSLDVDVVLDLMIHDIDIILSMVRNKPDEVRAVGLSILSQKVDIANVRLSFPGGCIANLTASRVSTERVRKLRLFQPHEYISLDYARQDVVAFNVANQQIQLRPLSVAKDEPLRLEIESFLDCVETRSPPRVGGHQAALALDVALSILDKIEEHSRVVGESLRNR